MSAELLKKVNPECLTMDGYDECIIGEFVDWRTTAPRLIYDGELIVKSLVSNDDMDDECAREFVSFNIEGAYVGPSTPLIVWFDIAKPSTE